MTELIKMSMLAKRSGVPAATIKHYLREGLLPPAAKRTSRNMAFYDPALIERIQKIKRLQNEHYLPLRVIKDVIDDPAALAKHEIAASAVARTLERSSDRSALSRKALVSAGVKVEDLDGLEALGLLTPIKKGRSVRYSGDDVLLLQTLKDARKAGLTEEMLPPQILAAYVRVIRKLVEVELEMFQAGVLPHAEDNLSQLTEAATLLSEQLVVTIRRKLLLPTLREMIEALPAKSKRRRR